MLSIAPPIVSPPSLLDLFPCDYSQARESFLESAEAAGCQTGSWPLKMQGAKGETLAIDVARWGAPSTTHWLLITSGMHGVEGPFGTAVQLGFLKLLAQRNDPSCGVLFLHAMNPFGYSWHRRMNENNVDLNRNFLLPGESFQGAHPLYHHAYRTINPHQRARIYDNFYLRALWLIAQHGKAALQSSLPVGQYHYPKGLFFGGQGPELSQQLVAQRLRDWMPCASEITHLDFHTGLGRWANYRLLIDLNENHPDVKGFTKWAPRQIVEWTSTNQTAYAARGSFGPWMKQVLFSNIQYRYAAAEFGTYPGVRVLHALVKELQTHFAEQSHHPRYQKAKKLIRETFVPASRTWRITAGRCGINLCLQSWLALKNINEGRRWEQEVSSVPVPAC